MTSEIPTFEKQGPDAATRAILVAALLVGAFLVAQILIGLATNLLASLAYAPPQMTAGYLQGAGYAIVTQALPVAVGVFLGFRLVAQITADIPLRVVLLRSIVATALGAVLQFIVSLAVFFSTAFTGSFFANSIPWSEIGGVVGSFLTTIDSTVSGFVGTLALVALAAVLLWLWLRRDGATGLSER